MLPRISRRPRRRLAVAVLALGLLVPLGPSFAQDAAVPGPIHAGNTFGWYPTAWRDEFIGPLHSVWHARGTGVVRTKNGMLTLISRHSGNVSATLAMPGHDRGRWEVRWQAKRLTTGHADYTVRTELIPAGTRKQYCGARNIALESYKLGHAKARFYINNLPNLAFRATRRGAYGADNWHTFAVEVTPTHLSWFVDAKVIRTERRPEALSGVPLTVRLSLNAIPGQQMNVTRMHLDWLRYWTLARHNGRSIAAPQTVMGHYLKACPPA